MKVKLNKIKDLEQLEFKKGINYHNLQIDNWGKKFLRVDIQTGIIDINYKSANGTHSLYIPDIIIKMVKEGWIEEK